MSGTTRRNTVRVDTVNKRYMRSSSEPRQRNREAPFSAVDGTSAECSAFSAVAKETMIGWEGDDEGSSEAACSRRRPLGVVDLNASPLVGSSAHPQNYWKANRQPLKGLRPPPFSRSASYDCVEEEQDFRETPIQRDLRRGIDPDTKRSLSVVDTAERDETSADITPSSSFSSGTPVFQKRAKDNPQSGFWTEEMSDMLTLKRANPVYDSEDDDAYYSYHVTKRMRTKEQSDDADTDEDDDVDFVHKMWMDNTQSLFRHHSDSGKGERNEGFVDLTSLIDGSTSEVPSRVLLGN